jgi:predicted nucleic acid-binding protein
VTDYYLDASALVKRYADELGSAWIRQITDPLDRIELDQVP